MKIKVLRTLKGQEGMLYKGHLREVTDNYGKELIKKGYAIDITDKEKEQAIVIEELEVNVVAPKEVKAVLSDCTVAELKEIAKDKEITGYSSMKKQELIDVLVGD